MKDVLMQFVHEKRLDQNIAVFRMMLDRKREH